MAAQDNNQPNQAAEVAKSQAAGYAKREAGRRIMASGVGKAARSAVSNAGKRLASTAAGAAVKGTASALAGAATGGLTTAAQLGWAARKQIGNLLTGLAAVPMLINSGIAIAAGSAWTTFGIAIVVVPAVLAFFIVIINSSAYVVPPGSANFLDDDGAPIIYASDCPLIEGELISENWGSYDSTQEIGHGSNSYWPNLAGGRGPCYYDIPQTSGCRGPLNSGNICYGYSNSSNRCPNYGAAADFISSISSAVYLPTVQGEILNWNYVRGFSNGSQGQTGIYTDTTGTHTIVLTHISRPAEVTNAPSGTRISTLYTWSRVHVHMEYQENGIWKKPENFFCAGAEAVQIVEDDDDNLPEYAEDPDFNPGATLPPVGDPDDDDDDSDDLLDIIIPPAPPDDETGQ